MIPASPRGEPWESVISAHPTRPSSAVALRKIQGRQPASQNSVSSRATFMRAQNTARAGWPRSFRHLAWRVAWHVMATLRARLGRGLAALEQLADRRLGAVILFASALGVYGVRMIAWPLVSGRDLDEYLSYYAQLGYRDPPLPSFMLSHTPLVPIFDGAALDVGGGRLAEPLLALCFAVSVTAWGTIGRSFGPRTAIAVAVVLLLYPGFGALFHELSSEPVFATAFALWSLAVVRAITRPSAARFAAVGAGVAALTLVRPGNQILVLLALYPLALRGTFTTRLVRAMAVVCAAVLPLAGWAVVNGLRYDEYTLARGGKGALFQHAVVVDRDVQASNGPATRQLIGAIRTHLLTRDPYRSYGITLDELLSSGSIRAAEDIGLTAFEVYGWNGGADVLDRAGREAVRAHRGKYVRNVVHTLWLEVSKPYYRNPPENSPTPAAASPPRIGADGVALPPTGSDEIPGGQNGWIARPDHGIHQVWTGPASYHFTFATPVLAKNYADVERRVGELFAALPGRTGNRALAIRWNQFGRWFPRPVVWLALGLLGLAIRRPAQWLAVAAPAVGCVLVVGVTGLVAPPDVRYLLPMVPAFVLLAAAGLLAPRREAVAEL